MTPSPALVRCYALFGSVWFGNGLRRPWPDAVCRFSALFGSVVTHESPTIPFAGCADMPDSAPGVCTPKLQAIRSFPRAIPPGLGQPSGDRSQNANRHGVKTTKELLATGPAGHVPRDGGYTAKGQPNRIGAPAGIACPGNAVRHAVNGGARSFCGTSLGMTTSRPRSAKMVGP